MGLFNWRPRDDDDGDEIAKGFEEGILSRWDIPWGEPDDVKDATLLHILGERQGEEDQP